MAISAFPPQAVTLTLTDEIDISQGDMLSGQRMYPKPNVCLRRWSSGYDEPLAAGRNYMLKVGLKVCLPGCESDIESISIRSSRQSRLINGQPGLELNAVGRIFFEANRTILFDPYRKNRATGSFIIIDRVTNVTVGAGMILDRHVSESIPSKSAGRTQTQHPLLNAVSSQVSAAARVQRVGHKPATIWLTGLPRSGKSTIAYALEARLWAKGCLVHVLDGVTMREGLSRDLGFSADDRSESSRRASRAARFSTRPAFSSSPHSSALCCR